MVPRQAEQTSILLATTGVSIINVVAIIYMTHGGDILGFLLGYEVSVSSLCLARPVDVNNR